MLRGDHDYCLITSRGFPSTELLESHTGLPRMDWESFLMTFSSCINLYYNVSDWPDENHFLAFIYLRKNHLSRLLACIFFLRLSTLPPLILWGNLTSTGISCGDQVTDWLYLGSIGAIQLTLRKLIILCFMEEIPFSLTSFFKQQLFGDPVPFLWCYDCSYCFPKGTLIQPLKLKFLRDAPRSHVILLLLVFF